jgi:hypothetical protein
MYQPWICLEGHSKNTDNLDEGITSKDRIAGLEWSKYLYIWYYVFFRIVPNTNLHNMRKYFHVTNNRFKSQYLLIFSYLYKKFSYKISSHIFKVLHKNSNYSRAYPPRNVACYMHYIWREINFLYESKQIN